MIVRIFCDNFGASDITVIIRNMTDNLVFT